MLGNNVIRKCNLRVHRMNQQEIVKVKKDIKSLGCFGVTWMHDFLIWPQCCSWQLDSTMIINSILSDWWDQSWAGEVWQDCVLTAHKDRCLDVQQRQCIHWVTWPDQTLRAPKTPTVHVERKVGQHADTFYLNLLSPYICCFACKADLFSFSECVYFLSKYDWSLKSRCERCDCLSAISSVCLFQCNILYIKSNRGQYRL